jgi:hypothetical protein
VFFNAKLPKYMNFGAIGAVIGHEMTHGFDDIGKQRNYKGRKSSGEQEQQRIKQGSIALRVNSPYGQ